MSGLKFHPVAQVFPLMEGPDFDRFCADIRANGLQVPIVIHPDGRILDGRNRYRACEATATTARYETWDGEPGAEVAFVLSLNLARRHMDESQRAMVAARLANMGEGRPREAASIDAVSQSDAAEILNVSRPSVQRARAVMDAGAPELIAAVDHGQIAVSLAARIAKQPEATQRAVVEKVRRGVKPIEATRQVRAELIEARRLESPSGKYRVIYADPPWSYGNGMPDMHSEARDHYPVLLLEDICALPIRQMAEDDAVLFLWVTSPIFEEAFAVVHAWGFAYKAMFVWDKVKHNMGHYNSVRHELLLICTRGSCQPDIHRLFDSVVIEERTEHSVKPALFYDIIDTIYPKGQRIELFARRAREGWASWGYEA